MLPRYSGELLYLCKKSIFKKCFTFENFSTFKVHRSPAKFTLKLMPEVESKLETAEVKHRKHPGIRKCPHVSLPEWLTATINRIILQTNEKNVLEDAKVLAKYLYLRRLPIEQEEVNTRTFRILEDLQVDATDPSTNTAKVQKYRKVIHKKLQYELHRWKPLEYTHRMALAYLVARLPPNYACTSHVFYEIMLADPSFEPKTCFDFGSGVGSATWAAHTFWGKSLKEYFCVDACAEMNTICEQLLTKEEGDDEDEESKIIKNVHFRQFLPACNKVKYNLVVASFSLMDLPSRRDRLRVIDTLWQKTDDMLVLIENGSRAAFSAILEAREYILQIENKMKSTSTTGAHTVVPCPHESACPLVEFSDSKVRPCHFFVKYFSPYPRDDTKRLRTDVFTYVVLRRGRKTQDETQWPRIVKPVIKSTRKAYCRLCCPNGKLQELIVTKRVNGRHVYRCIRESSQGDLLPVEVLPSKNKDIDLTLDEELKAARRKSEELDDENETCKF